MSKTPLTAQSAPSTAANKSASANDGAAAKPTANAAGKQATAQNAASAVKPAGNWASIAAGSGRQQQQAAAASVSASSGSNAADSGNSAGLPRDNSQGGQARAPASGNAAANTAANHGRKPSAAAKPFESKAIPVKQPENGLAFGAVDKSSAILSSSPAQPPHLSQNSAAPTFGNFAAQPAAAPAQTSASAAQATAAQPAATSSSAAGSDTAPVKAERKKIAKVDINRLFQDQAPSPTENTQAQSQHSEANAASGSLPSSGLQSGTSSRRPSAYEAQGGARPSSQMAQPNQNFAYSQASPFYGNTGARPFSPGNSQQSNIRHQPSTNAPSFGGFSGMQPSSASFTPSQAQIYGTAPQQQQSAYGKPNGIQHVMSPSPQPQGTAHPQQQQQNSVAPQSNQSRPAPGAQPFVPGAGVARTGPSPLGHQHRASLGPNSPRVNPAGVNQSPAYHPSAQGYGQQQWMMPQAGYQQSSGGMAQGMYAYPGYQPYPQQQFYPQSVNAQGGQQNRAGLPSSSSQYNMHGQLPGSPAPLMRPSLSSSTSNTYNVPSSNATMSGGPPSESSATTASAAAGVSTPSMSHRQHPHSALSANSSANAPFPSVTSPSATQFTPAHAAQSNTFIPSSSTSGSLAIGAAPFTPGNRPTAVLAKPPSKKLEIKRPPTSVAKDKDASKATPSATSVPKSDDKVASAATGANVVVKPATPAPASVDAAADAKREKDAKDAEASKQAEKEKREAAEKLEADRKQKELEEAESKRKAEAEAAAAKEAAEKQESAAKAQREKEAAEEAERQRVKVEGEAAAAAAQEAAERVAAEQSASTSAPADSADTSAGLSVPVSRQASSQASSDGPSTPATPAVDVVTPTTKKPVPEPLDIAAAQGVSEEQIVAPGSALSHAHRIEDISAVPYPEQYTIAGETHKFTAMLPALNAKAQPGKYRYDRDFLLQFMAICTEKPEQLPSLVELGMIDDGPASANTPIPRSASYTGRPRNAGSIPNTPIGPGRPGVMNRAVSTGFAAMGNFSTAAPLGSSEARFAAATAAAAGGFGLPGRPGAIGRQPSAVGGPGGIPIGGVSGRGMDRNSGRGRRRNDRPPAHAMPLPSDVAPLETSENRWTPSVQTSRAAANVPDDAPATVERKVKALLNKLTVENFESIAGQILAWADKSMNEQDGRILKQVIALIFEKATDEATWSGLYAKLCLFLHAKINPQVADHTLPPETTGQPTAGGRLFRRYLLTRCQQDYEKGWAQKESATLAAKGKEAEDKTKKEQAEKDAEAAGVDKEVATKGVDFSDEYYAAEKAKRRGLGLVKFIGELFKLGMMKEKIMHECIKKLINNLETPEEEDIESLCRLLLTVGKQLDEAQGRQYMDIYFVRLQKIIDNKAVSSRLTFMIVDVLETRKKGWNNKSAPTGPKTIAEIHEDAARQQREEDAKRVASQGRGLPPRINMERGGSRRGQGREMPAGPDGWQAAPRQQQKAGDLTTLGKIRSASGSPAVFGAGPRSKQTAKDESSSPSAPANPFAVLAEASGSTEAPSAPAEPQRRRLNLAPRTITSTSADDAAAAQSDDQEVEDGEVAEEDAATQDAPATEAGSVLTDAIKRSIDNSVKEYLGVRDVKEGKATFEALHRNHRGLLAQAFIVKVVDGKKVDVDAIIDLFAGVDDADLIDEAAFRDAFIPTVTDLEDIATDSPKAISNVAALMAAAGLSEENVTTLQSSMISNEDDLERIQQKLMDAFKAATSA